MSFDNDKKVFLSKVDKSKIGGIDKDILPLVKKINSKKNYYTTSSCSGRIVLFKPSKKFKPGSRWLFVKHSLVGLKDFKEIKKILKESKNPLWLMAEPVILHVNCRSVEDGKILLNLVRSIGLKHSGIVSMNKKIILEIIGNERMDSPLVADLDDSYLRFLIKESNKKLKKTKIKLKKIEDFLKLIK